MTRHILSLVLILGYLGLAIMGSLARWEPAAAVAQSPSRLAGIAAPKPPAREESSGKHLVTVKGEIVDYYCYIEKGLRGLSHRECGMRCVMGDVCMGILTEDDQLYMISVDHIRAMAPLVYQGVPDPWQKCRPLMGQKVILKGNAMERKGQKIIEIVNVWKAE